MFFDILLLFSANAKKLAKVKKCLKVHFNCNELSENMNVSSKRADMATKIVMVINWVAYYLNNLFKDTDVLAKGSDVA